MISKPVLAREEILVIPTYLVPPPERNPIFLEKRINQGTTGRVYPQPLTDRLSDERADRPYQVVRLENEYLQILILPEIGGRILAGRDKTNQYDFFYRQHVIKPALIGLYGPWISGGVEWCWPLHHRPSTFMPVEYTIEAGNDGSCTVWLSEHDPFCRMKGMVGLCLRPDQAVLEAKVRLYNRTPLVQSFLWWANVAVHVNPSYQVVMPPDVTYVTHHARQFMSPFPFSRGYAMQDYGDGIDLTWYKNWQQGMLSYFAAQSRYDFFGGYDHSRQAGLIHVSNHHIAPGKKMFTWSNDPAGQTWEHNLTDHDGPYIELMAGAYTDNQPDFSWLQPFETKTFSQFWYPVQQIGPAKNANREAAVNLDVEGRQARLGVYATHAFRRAYIRLTAGGRSLIERRADLGPGAPLLEQVALPRRVEEADLILQVVSADGRELIRYIPERRKEEPIPPPAAVPPAPVTIHSTEELYLTGLHLEQYYQSIWTSGPYWQEVLRREPGDARTHNALGLLKIRRGQFAEAEAHFRKAIQRLDLWNSNPRDGEPLYNLGLALRYQGRFDEAYAAFYKAIWSYAWQSAGFYALAEIDCRRRNLETALEHLERSLQVNLQNLKARNLKAAILRRLGRRGEAEVLARQTSALDRLDFWSRYELALLAPEKSPRRNSRLEELARLMRGEAQTYLDIVFDYAGAALWEEAGGLLSLLADQASKRKTVHPMVLYTLGYIAREQGRKKAAQKYFQRAAAASPAYCFPERLEEMLVLQAVLEANPQDAKAPYYLGNLLYDKKRYDEAIQSWKTSCDLEPGFSIPWRNLGMAYHNIRRDSEVARECYLRALAADPQDPRLLFELDQLNKLHNVPPGERLAQLEAHMDLVEQREYLLGERIRLYNQLGQAQKALDLVLSRQFHVWEGGWGVLTGQYTAAQLLLGEAALASGQAEAALEHFQKAIIYPQSLGEWWWSPPEARVHYLEGLAYEELNDPTQAQASFRQAAKEDDRIFLSDPAMAYYQALALRKLGQEVAAEKRLHELLDYAAKLVDGEVKFSYFTTSLANFNVLDDELEKRDRTTSAYLNGLARLGLGQIAEARQALEVAVSLDVNHLEAQVELRKLHQA
jgi:tetratricopeptide (TPR) repeat protein